MLAVYFLIIFISAGISIASVDAFTGYSREQYYTGVIYCFVNFLPFLLFVFLTIIVVFVSFCRRHNQKKSCGKAIEKSGIGFQIRNPIFFHINIIK